MEAEESRYFFSLMFCILTVCWFVCLFIFIYNYCSFILFYFIFKNRSEHQCQHRWYKVLDPDLVKGPWTKEEDEKVRLAHGKIRFKARGRDSARIRFVNVLGYEFPSEIKMKPQRSKTQTVILCDEFLQKKTRPLKPAACPRCVFTPVVLVVTNK